MSKKRSHAPQGPRADASAEPLPVDSGQESAEKRPAPRKADKPEAPKKKSFREGLQKTGRSMSKWGRELKSEIKKVVWPTKRQVVNNTGVVLAVIAIVGIAIWLMDLVFENIILKGLLMLVTGF